MKRAPVSIALLACALSACSHAPNANSDGGFTPAWVGTPTQSPYYINSVATTGDGARTVAGTFVHTYSEEPGELSDSPSQYGIFGTYCYDSKGTLVWKDEFKGWQGVYWVDVSRDGKSAASGGWFSHSPLKGFVRAFDAVSGARLLDCSTNARVNQVALSSDGTWLVSAADTLMLFKRNGNAYQKTDEYPVPGGATMETIALSADGSTLIAGDYLPDKKPGQLLLFTIQDGKFGSPVAWNIPGGGYSHCVRINPSGTAFAAGGSSGDFFLFDTAAFRANPQPAVTYHVPNAGSVYCVALSDDASAFVGVVNAGQSAGCVYFVQRQGGSGTLKWTCKTEHNPNCVSLNSRANLLAVADGHPDGTPGGYYLIDANSGGILGQYGTSNMSWPIEISESGTAVVAGSDDSHVYYFQLPGRG